MGKNTNKKKPNPGKEQAKAKKKQKQKYQKRRETAQIEWRQGVNAILELPAEAEWGKPNYFFAKSCILQRPDQILFAKIKKFLETKYSPSFSAILLSLLKCREFDSLGYSGQTEFDPAFLEELAKEKIEQIIKKLNALVLKFFRAPKFFILTKVKDDYLININPKDGSKEKEKICLLIGNNIFKINISSNVSMTDQTKNIAITNYMQQKPIYFSVDLGATIRNVAAVAGKNPEFTIEDIFQITNGLSQQAENCAKTLNLLVKFVFGLSGREEYFVVIPSWHEDAHCEYQILPFPQMEQTTILGLFQLLQMPAALYSSSLDVSAITEKLLLTNCCIIFFMLLLGVTPTIWDGIGVNEMKFFPFVFGWKTGADFFVKIESLYHFLQDPAFKKANENVDWHIRWGNLFNLWQQQNPSVSFTNVLGLPAFSARQNLAHELIQQFCKALVVKINTELPGQVQSQTDIQLLIDAIAQSAAQSHASCFVFKL